MATLLIISHTEHYLTDEVYYGWGATVREIDHLATLFDRVVHIAPLHDKHEMNRNALSYEAPNVIVRPVRPSGGRTLVSKLGILAAIPGYLRAIREEIRQADVVHVRCPANISLTALLFLMFSRKKPKVWLKYAGNWRPDTIFPLSYSLQRWMLRRFFVNAIVTANGTGDGDPKHVVSMLNPSLTVDEIRAALEAAKHKELRTPYRLLTVGRTESEKGIRQALEVVKTVGETHGEIHLDIIGDGPERKAFEEHAVRLGIVDRVTFHGWLGRSELNGFYAQAHILLLLSKTEGWPKVVGEAMAFGCVPICSNVSSIGYHLARFNTGSVVDRNSIDDAVRAVIDLLSNSKQWKQQSTNATHAAVGFTYEGYRERIAALLGLPYGSPHFRKDVLYIYPYSEELHVR